MLNYTLKHLKLITLFIFFDINTSIAQNYIDIIINKNQDTIKCHITLVNNQNIFYSYKKKKSAETTYISLSDINDYTWISKGLNPEQQNGKTNNLILFDTTNTIKLCIKFITTFSQRNKIRRWIGDFYYTAIYNSLTVSLYYKNHNIFFGPNFITIPEKSLNESVDKYEKNYFGGSTGYRYYINSKRVKTNLFFQYYFSIAKINYKEHSLGSGFIEKSRYSIENTIGIGINYKLLKNIHTSTGVGIGFRDGLECDDNWVGNGYIGIEYLF